MTGYASTLARIQAAFEKAGVEFIGLLTMTRKAAWAFGS
jgi:hypothetical protein